MGIINSEVDKKVVLKHGSVLEKLKLKAKKNPNTLGFLVIGSVATKTHSEKSDIDVITILRNQKPSSGIKSVMVDGIIVDSLFFTYNVFVKSVNSVPYLLHTLVDSKILFDPENIIEPLVSKVKDYFAKRPQLVDQWNLYFKQSKDIKLRTGCRASNNGKTIIDVWNELEKRYSGGKIKRPFFNSFYLTNSTIFSLVKRFIVLKS